METYPTKFVGRISLSAESLGEPFNRQVWKPALLIFPGRGSRLKKRELGSWEVGRYGNIPYEVCKTDIPIRRGMETCLTKFIGRISLSAGIFEYPIQSAGMETCLT